MADKLARKRTASSKKPPKPTPVLETGWNPALYEQFHDLRLRPALDLMARVPTLPKGRVVDLGCGNGAAGPALSLHFADRSIIGVDASPEMLAQASDNGAYKYCELGDVRSWEPPKPPALIFSNAVLNWVPGHDTVLPRLTGVLRAGGVLACQMPDQHDAPSHKLAREVAAALFPDRFSTPRPLHVRDMAFYADLLDGLGQADVWTCTYVQKMDASREEHPVVTFTRATYLKPYLEALSETDQALYLAQYSREIEAAYPRTAGRALWFPFRRLFAVVKIPE
ncbi:Trans-aconitate 2-methyltransferase [Aquimixticola soesokkakensis]|uniref:Trans-aconitate 2-methyltransferase n=1 Tax=Aquimixticola soesokkakensis TaxID=1519096 RepID=A0A1Y5S5D8_9RHOB|nr:methyltransferase domain-containing protein [Aquimixticola soesokkakensis]SLN32712.1 Trans-aconitate 2-methyltransferase [Aquimixticola soesokkakensis]